MLVKRFSRGDTLIEVLFAITIFSLVAVGGISIMNQGTATSQRALEITLVRNEIDAQAETLRFLNASYVAAYQNSRTGCPPTYSVLSGPAGQWQAMRCDLKNRGVSTISNYGGGDKCEVPKYSFIFNTKTATYYYVSSGKIGLADTFSQTIYDKTDSSILTKASGVWIEAVVPDDFATNSQNNANYIDFHIRACWDSPGQLVPVTIGTIVRLYEPRN